METVSPLLALFEGIPPCRSNSLKKRVQQHRALRFLWYTRLNKQWNCPSFETPWPACDITLMVQCQWYTRDHTHFRSNGNRWWYAFQSARNALVDMFLFKLYNIVNPSCSKTYIRLRKYFGMCILSIDVRNSYKYSYNNETFVDVQRQSALCHTKICNTQVTHKV